MSAWSSGGPLGDDSAAANVAALERERLLSYIEWGEVEVPRWYWPVYGAALATFVAAYALGPLWGAVGAVVFAATMGWLISSMTSRTGVSTPRFRAMPRALKMTFVPTALVGLGSVGALVGALLIAQDPPFPLLGLTIGTTMAVAGQVHTVWYRREARRLGREHGLRR